MDPDLNRYDSEHVTTVHPLMSGDAWREAHLRAWDTFYTMEHPDLPFHISHPRCGHPHPDHSNVLDYGLVPKTKRVQRLDP
jgi:hypothetical protein